MPKIADLGLCNSGVRHDKGKFQTVMIIRGHRTRRAESNGIFNSIPVKKKMDLEPFYSQPTICFPFSMYAAHPVHHASKFNLFAAVVVTGDPD
jgi:hypothetical protein